MALPVAVTGEDMFGGPAYVAAGYPGDGFWLNIGLPMRIAFKPGTFNSSLKNEVGQTMPDSILQSIQSGMVTLTLRRHNAQIITALLPGLTRQYAKSDTRNEAYAYSPRTGPVKPIGLHIRPQFAYGTTKANHPGCWWIPSAVFKELGEFVYKVENSTESNEDFTVELENTLLFKDYTPGNRGAISVDGRLLFRGDNRHFATANWEDHLPFGYIDGISDAPTAVTSSAIGSDKFTVGWTAPVNNVAEGQSAIKITGYKILHRVRRSESAFTEVDAAVDDTSKEITGLATGTTYEVRIYATTAKGKGAQSIPIYVATS